MWHCFEGFRGFGGMWMIFPIIMFLIMIFVCFSWRRQRGGFFCCPPWNNSPWNNSCSGYNDSNRAESAIEILNNRYAKGEITKEEYTQMKKDILG